MPRVTATLVGATALVCLAAGCGADSAEPVASPASTTAASSDMPATVRPSFAKPSRRALLVFTRVRVTEHRIVLVFQGTGRPGWAVQYADRARLDGSGTAVHLGGDSVLDVNASGTTWPADGYYSGPRRIRPAHGDVSEVYVGGTFEGTTEVLVGLTGGRVPVRVSTRTNPARLVVDLRV